MQANAVVVRSPAAVGPRQIGGMAPAAPEIRPGRSGAILMLLSFVLLVAVPTFCASIYYGVIATDIFVSESKFVIRGSLSSFSGMSVGFGSSSSSSGGSSSGGSTTGGSSSSGSSSSGGSSSGGSSGSGISSALSALSASTSNQDAHIIAAYIKSLPLLAKLDSEIGLRKVLARSDIDPLSRLDPDAPLESFRRYWNSIVSADVDNMSGILTLQVRAFSAKDAQIIGAAILRASEVLVNEMSTRRRGDALSNATEELTRAEQRVQAARLAVQAFRNKSGQIDPGKQGDMALASLTMLRSDRLKLENELIVSQRALTDESPTIQVLKARLRAMTDQIAGTERMMTGPAGGSDTTSGLLSQYEGLEVEREFAQRFSLLAQAGLERARMTAEQRQLYLISLVDPTRPETPLLPRRLENTIVTFVCGFALWSIFSMLVAAIKDTRV